jgi:hypothetical protein
MSNENYMNESGKVREELEDLAPSLAAMKKTNPFAVPENYFSNLEERMLEKVRPHAPVATPEPKLTLWQHLVQLIKDTGNLFTGRILAPVLTACIILACGMYFMPKTTTDNTSAQFASLSKEEVQTYVEAHADEYDLTELGDETITGIASLDEFKPSVDGISDEALQEYLTDNIDEQTLTDELL